MYIDFKTTVWERIQIPEEIEKEFVEKVKSKELQSASDAFNLFLNHTDEFNYETLLDTSEQMCPEENEGSSTIELHSELNSFNDKILWENGDKREES